MKYAVGLAVPTMEGWYRCGVEQGKGLLEQAEQVVLPDIAKEDGSTGMMPDIWFGLKR